MALFECPNCKTWSPIIDSRAFCPKCGRVLQHNPIALKETRNRRYVHALLEKSRKDEREQELKTED